ncbi:MAG: hypothetical protein KKG93_05525, partial [Bacteroidetes bacterium]|nr:hypothetical protein [Bacteroidota bacterium]
NSLKAVRCCCLNKIMQSRILFSGAAFEVIYCFESNPDFLYRGCCSNNLWVSKFPKSKFPTLCGRLREFMASDHNKSVFQIFNGTLIRLRTLWRAS